MVQQIKEIFKVKGLYPFRLQSNSYERQIYLFFACEFALFSVLSPNVTRNELLSKFESY